MTKPGQIDQYNLPALAGAKVQRAQSSLDSFAVVFEDGRALNMLAAFEEGECLIKTTIVDAATVAAPTEAVCAVDWSWIYGQTVQANGVKEGLGVSGPSIKITLSSIGTITVSGGMWQGKPFLSFMPYKPQR